ncbi:MAG: hypothetical protein JRJ26_13240 [Deltaproteobacteria bacterium]|nr:hypothetical protein [Deltaproteobacteria bacterium]
MVFPACGFSFMEGIFRRLRSRFGLAPEIPPDSEREIVELPDEGRTVSIEKALNSRCTSDYDEDPRNFHWGMFDRMKRLSEDQVHSVVELARIPRFTALDVGIRAKEGLLTFVIDNHASGIERDWAMIESGMQHQAVGLVCAALGVGMAFRNLGKDGKTLSDGVHATVNIQLDAMKPSYGASFWSDMPPVEKKPWQRGNLPDPARDGTIPLTGALERLKTEKGHGQQPTEESVGQLLWAARGRTPHFYKSRPWGMTVPTWAGEQGISSVYFVSERGVSKYVNWHGGRPTHLLGEAGQADTQEISRVLSSFSASLGLVVLGRNEGFGRALWEIGYQLLNLLVQAHGLGISYRAVLLDEAQRTTLRRLGIMDPVALLVT